jgi:hypothetical protein
VRGEQFRISRLGGVEYDEMGPFRRFRLESPSWILRMKLRWNGQRWSKRDDMDDPL